ncbi:hypothetical protein NDA10_006550 [Ustilago hordei]|nr:hypothetical protein NDA10_006550 [Ustilago hordei]
MGPKVMVTTADPFEDATDSGDRHTGSTKTGDPEAMDLSSFQQSMDLDHEEEEHDDGDDKGNISGSQILSLVSIGTHNLGVVEASVANTADYDLILGFTKLWRLKPLGTININVMMTPRSGVSVDDDEVDGVGDEIGDVDDNEVDGVGDEIGDVDDNEVDGVGDKVGGVNTSVQCVDLMLEVIPGPQWTTAFGSIYIRTANLLWAPSDVR